MKKWIALAAAVCLSACVGNAEVYTAVTTARQTVSVEADVLCAEAGQTVRAGDTVGSNRVTKVFASEDGVVSSIAYEEGDSVSGTVLEIMPTEKYAVYCKSEEVAAYAGETVYLKCTKNGTHRGVGVVCLPDGNEFRVLTTGGEFYVGETVYIYRDDAFSSDQKIGIGTVVINDTLPYEGSGKLAHLHVTVGESVERGELLYETTEADTETVTAETDGVVLSAENGVLTIAPDGDLVITATIDENALSDFSVGSTVEIRPAYAEEDENSTGTVTGISGIDGEYTVTIEPEDDTGFLYGMTVTVTTR